MQRGELSFSLATIVSGGESGAERAVLDFAIARNIPYLGSCPRGRYAEDGRISARYQLTETRTTEVSESIWQNVSAAQATVVFDSGVSGRHPRTIITLAACKHAHRPFVVIGSPFDVEADVRMLIGFITAYTPTVLHLTGRSEISLRGIYNHVGQVLKRLPLRPAPKEKKAKPDGSERIGPDAHAYPNTNTPWV
jgi:hypothetical protein